MPRTPSQQRYAEKNREALKVKALERYHANKDRPGEKEKRSKRNKDWNNRNPGYHLKQYRRNKARILFRNRKREILINTIDELLPLCGSCNDKKGVREVDYRGR